MAKKLVRSFFAYPSGPQDLRTTIDLAVSAASGSATGLDVRGWPATSVVGEHIADSVRNEIVSAKYLIADVTVRNPNVYYEIGFAIGRGVPILPTVNRSHADAHKRLQSEGYFDNIKFEGYENKDQLVSAITKFNSTPLLDVYSRDLNTAQPLFILDTLVKTDFRNSIVSAVKEAKVFFRAFDPAETSRFSTVKIIAEATSSVAAVVPLLASHLEDADRHNLRASFLAGLMHGLGKPVLIIQSSDGPVPLDYREDVDTPSDLLAAGTRVRDFATEAVKELQNRREPKASKGHRTRIQSLWLGASAAENEFRVLDQYFLETSEYIRAVRGDGKIIVGRKGSGKTAIFFMARNHFRSAKNVVIDLKPESHELVELRELLVRFSSVGMASHTFAGFWYVLIIIEIALKLVEELDLRAKHDHKAFLASADIQKELDRFGIPARADFTSRLKLFVSRITQSIRHEIETAGSVSPDKLTNFVYGKEQRSLRQAVAKHVTGGRVVSLLFDNLDKGWPAAGIDAQDAVFIRSLIDSLNRVQSDLATEHVDFRFSVFLRNDVYEMLVENTSDRGKDGAIPIDWSDREKLKVIIRKRIASSAETTGGSANWEGFFPSKVGDQDSFDYAIDHCLMRPRFLIDIVERSVSFAINRQHQAVTGKDLEDAVRQHSYSLVDDFGYEIRDATGVTNKIIDAFLGCKRVMLEQEVLERIGNFPDEQYTAEGILELLIWYGFIGIKSGKSERYIYDYNYSMRRMRAEMERGEAVSFVVNPAFYVGLGDV